MNVNKELEAIKGLHVRILLIVIFVLGTVAANVSSSATNLYEDGQFELIIPDGWFTSQSIHRGERMLFVLPDSVPDLEALQYGDTLDTPASVGVSVSIIPGYPCPR